MVGVWVGSYWTDEKIGSENQTPDLFVKFKKKDARPPFWAFVTAKSMPGGPGGSWDRF